MPELPEVETMRRGIAHLAGSRVLSAKALRCARKPICIEPASRTLGRRIRGRTISRVDRVGKRVVLWLDEELALVIEPRMTGLVLLADPPSREHLRFEMRFDPDDGVIYYWDRRGLGSIRLLEKEQFDSAFANGHVGPDALTVTWDALRDRLSRSRRAIKVALLDQAAVAGIGNLYASEMLHVARIHPERRCDGLRRPSWQRLHEAMRQVLEEAIRYEGSTLGDGTYRTALNQNGGYQNYHRVYNRAGQPCPGCRRTTIRRIVQAQRSTFFCPRCQRTPRGGT